MNKLITKSLQEGEAGFILRFPKPLQNEFELKQTEWIAQYFIKHGSLPSLVRFSAEFPYFLPVNSEDPLTDLFDTELAHKRNVLFRAKVAEKQTEILGGSDPLGMVTELYGAFAINSTGTVSSSTYDRTQYFEERPMYSYGVTFIDSSTGGLVGGDLTYIVGRPGSNKTTFAEWLVTGWRLEGRRVLYISNENLASEVMPKLDSFMGGWNPIQHRYRRYDARTRQLIFQVDKYSRLMDGEIIVPEEPAFTTTEVANYITEYSPDIVLIDGVYLMNEGKRAVTTWEDVTAVSRGIKRLARKTKLPFIGVIQANREAEGGKVGRNNLAHSDAFLADADTIIALNKNQGSGKVIGQVIKSRWGTTSLLESFEMMVNFENMTIGFTNEVSEVIEDENW